LGHLGHEEERDIDVIATPFERKTAAQRERAKPYRIRPANRVRVKSR